MAPERTLDATLRSASPGSMPAGQVLGGRYRLLRMRRAGGMGAVYEATDETTGQTVAVKVMHAFLNADPDARERFAQEAEVARAIDHPNVVQVFDAGVDEASGAPYLAMELLKGCELSEHLRRRGVLPKGEALAILTDIARALDRAHAQRIVHRDLKPQNVFLARLPDGSSCVKVLDFGIAKVLRALDASSTRAAGTPYYMAPEQTKRSSNIGPTTDVWSLGLLAYAMLVGRSYWLEDETPGVLAEVLVRPLEAPSCRARRFGASLPEAFDTWFFRCVNRDPSARFPRVGDAVTALAAALEAHPLSRIRGISATLPSSSALPVSEYAATLVDPSPFVRAGSSRRPGVGLFLAAMMGLVLGVVSTLFVVARGEHAPPPRLPANGGAAATHRPTPPPQVEVARGALRSS